MKKINWSRVLLGGLAAGLLMNLLDFSINVLWWGQDWTEATKARNLDPAALQCATATGWIIVDFLSGLFVVWLYAAIRPRYGKGVKTALIAGAAMWFITHLIAASYFFMGFAPLSLMIKTGTAEILSALLPAYVGAWLYKEK